MNPFNGACQLCFEDFDTDVTTLASATELHRLPISCVNCEKTLCYQCYKYLQTAQTRNIESYQGIRCPGCKYEMGFPRKQPSFNRALCMVLRDFHHLTTSSRPHHHTTGESTAGSPTTARGAVLRAPPVVRPHHPSVAAVAAHAAMATPIPHSRVHISMPVRHDLAHPNALAGAHPPAAPALTGLSFVNHHQQQQQPTAALTSVVGTTVQKLGMARASLDNGNVLAVPPPNANPIPAYVDLLVGPSSTSAGMTRTEAAAGADEDAALSSASRAIPDKEVPATDSKETPHNGGLLKESLNPSSLGFLEADSSNHQRSTNLDESSSTNRSQPSLEDEPVTKKRRKKDETTDGGESVQLGVPLQPHTRGKGWEGLAQLDSTEMPMSLAEILLLMDHWFYPDASYYQHLHVDADLPDSKGVHRYGKKTRDKLRKLRMRFPNLPGVAWYHDSSKRDKDWVPPNKEMLEGFVKVLMELDELLK